MPTRSRLPFRARPRLRAMLVEAYPSGRGRGDGAFGADAAATSGGACDRGGAAPIPGEQRGEVGDFVVSDPGQHVGKLSRHNEVAKAFDYMLKRIDVFTRFLDDGRICLSNNAAERELRGIALGRKSWLFAGSDRGGERAAVMLTLIQTAKLNDIDPQAWLADVLAWIADHKITELAALLPWNWRHAMAVARAA